jgi:F0F1-type ATP synthase assembly protein I
VEENKKNLNNNKNSLPSQNNGLWWKPAVQVLSEVSTWIVVPIVCALVFGKMLDTHYGTKPVIFLVFAGLGFLITCFGMYRVVKNYTKKVNFEIKPESRNKEVGEEYKK